MKKNKKAKRNEFIPLYCKIAGIDQKDLAAKFEIDPSFLSQINIGHRFAPIELAYKLEIESGGLIPARKMVNPKRLMELAKHVDEQLALCHDICNL